MQKNSIYIMPITTTVIICPTCKSRNIHIIDDIDWEVKCISGDNAGGGIVNEIQCGDCGLSFWVPGGELYAIPE